MDKKVVRNNEAMGVLGGGPYKRSVRDQQMQVEYGKGVQELYCGRCDAGAGVLGSDNLGPITSAGQLGPSYGMRTEKDIAMQQVYAGKQYAHLWDSHEAKECYDPLNSYPAPTNKYDAVVRLRPANN